MNSVSEHIENNEASNLIRRCSSRTRSGSQSGSLSGYSPKLDGIVMVYNIIRNLVPKGKEDVPIAWNDVRSHYRKETGRTLNAEELNLMCGTTDETKHDLLHQHLSDILKPVDDKALFFTFVSNCNVASEGNSADPSSTSSPAAISTYSAVTWQNTAVDDSKGDDDHIHEEVFNPEDDHVNTNHSDNSAESNNKHNDLENTGSSIPQKIDNSQQVMDVKKDLDNCDMDAIAIAAVNEILDTVGDQEDDGEQYEEVEIDFVMNSDDVVEKFERSLLEHKNSIGSIDGDENSRIEDALALATEGEESLTGSPKEQTNDTVMDGEHATIQEVSTMSSQMNAAFLASESQQISFDSCPGSNGSSGIQGYTTSQETCSPDLSGGSDVIATDGSLLNSSDPIEATLCSSRLDDDSGDMPQPDVSPLTEDDADKVVHHVKKLSDETERPSLEERVPHLHYTPKNDSSDLATSPLIEKNAVRFSDEPPEVFEPKTKEANIIVTQDVETDDDVLYDDDESQTGEDLAEKVAVDECDALPSKVLEHGDVDVEENGALNKMIDSAKECPEEIAKTGEASNYALDTDNDTDGVIKDELVVQKKKPQLRIARRRWFECCTLL